MLIGIGATVWLITAGPLKLFSEASTPPTSNSNLPCGNYGDVNGDGRISQSDAYFIFTTYVSQPALVPVTTEEHRKADVDNDKKITVADVQWILRYIIGNATTFPACSPSGEVGIKTIESVTVDDQAIFYSTFTSHNQKVVFNQYGYFITYIHHDSSCPANNYNVCNDINTWRLARSKDGGRTFTTIYEETNNTRAPVIETDLQGNIYLMRANNMTGQNQPTEFYKFSAATLADQTITPEIKIPINTLPTKSGKYAMEINNSRREIYYFTLPGWFAVLNFDGTLKKAPTLLTRDGPSAGMHYPYLYLDEKGVLYAAWTTVKDSAYRSIHFIKSEDGGISWKKAGGGSLGNLPIIADETGPADMISLPEEYGMGPFLTTFTVNYQENTPLAHFMYVAGDNQHYTRFNLSQNKIDTNTYPYFQGETISVGYHSGLCVHKNGTTKIYCVNKLRGQNGIGILRSDDNGKTWHDHAKTEVTDYQIYAIGGSPQITDDGHIIGTYTDGLDFCAPDSTPCSVPKRVRFFKVSVN